jgi:nucleoside-diphosphate-sugar epimerase
MLADHILCNAEIAKRVTHIRLHTLYGGRIPHEFMFLGRILNAIALQLPMEMTSGRQLREYHDVHDDALAIWEILESNTVGVIDLNHGSPIALRNLAGYLFNRFDCDNLLRLGILRDPVAENYEKIFTPHPFYSKIQYRFSLPAIGDYIDRLLPRREKLL